MFTNKLDSLKVDFCQPYFSTEVIKQGWVVFFKNYMFINQVRSLFPVPHQLIQERDFHSDTMPCSRGWGGWAKTLFQKIVGWRSRIPPFPHFFQVSSIKNSSMVFSFLDGVSLMEDSVRGTKSLVSRENLPS